MTSIQPLIDVARDGKVATVTLNRPEKRNAINDAMRNALIDALNEIGRAHV